MSFLTVRFSWYDFKIWLNTPEMICTIYLIAMVLFIGLSLT